MTTREFVHLYRGAPAVREWSIYQRTDKKKTLCGLNPKFEGTEDPAEVTCEFCNYLLKDDEPEVVKTKPKKAKPAKGKR